MAARKAARLVQQAISQGAGSAYPPAGHHMGNGWPPLLPFHFSLDLIACDEADLDGDSDVEAYAVQDEDQPVSQIDADRRYRLLAFASTTGLARPGGLIITADIELKARCPGCKQVTIHDPVRPVSYPPPSRFEHAFEMTVDAECPIIDELSLELCYRVRGSRQWETLATKVVTLNGTCSPELDTEVMKVISLPPNAPPPPRVAFLKVSEPRPGVLNVTAQNFRRRSVIDELDELPKNELAAFAKDEANKDEANPERLQKAEHLKGEMSGISRKHLSSLRKWLQDLLDMHRDTLDVIICDATGHNFPWEMLEVTPGRYLGALARVARWIPANTDFGLRQLMLGGDPPEFSASVLAFVDTKNLQGGSRDVEILQSLPDQSRKLCETMTTFKKHLRGDLSSIGMVYLGCHGMFSYSDKSKNYVGKLKNPSGYVSALTLNGVRPVREKRPLAFVNACHSGRLMREGSSVFGLAEVFLALDVDGYIGTLGPVDTHFAADVLHGLVHDLKTQDAGVEPAEFLRRLRAAAVQQWSDDNVDEATIMKQYGFIFAFMYTYYGHPGARLRLSPTPDKRESA